jgi:excisionase family DNA binding protein
MTIKEVCGLLKIGDRTAYDLCREGKLGGAAKIGNQWRINREDLLAWLKAGGGARFRSRSEDDA